VRLRHLPIVASLPLLIATVVLGQSPFSADTYTLSETTALFIDGTSSLHDWTCNVERTVGQFEASIQPDAGIRIDSGSLRVETADIECGKRTMNRKLRNALEVNGATSISFELTEFNPAGSDGMHELTGLLTVAGQSKEITIQATITTENGVTRIEGEHALLQTDFGVDPPTALLGRLKTGDEVVVRFIAVAQNP